MISYPSKHYYDSELIILKSLWVQNGICVLSASRVLVVASLEGKTQKMATTYSITQLYSQVLHFGIRVGLDWFPSRPVLVSKMLLFLLQKNSFSLKKTYSSSLPQIL